VHPGHLPGGQQRDGRTKKRIEAARRWAAEISRNQRGPDESQQDLERMGVRGDAARQWLAAQQPEPEGGAEPLPDLTQPTEVWPENWPALTLLLRLRTQWHRDIEGRRLGLRFEAVEAAMRLMGTKRKRRPELFEHLVEMQDAALEVLHGV
jgi:hypothetical protein